METKIFQRYERDHITDEILQEAAQLLAITTASGVKKWQNFSVPLRGKVSDLEPFT